MRFYEYEAKAMFARHGAPLLTGRVTRTPEEAHGPPRDILALRIKGQEPRGVLVEQRAPVAKEYFAAVTWDGRRKLPVIIFSDMGGIDIEKVAEKHPEHVSRTHL